jgi:hypothetical protein
VATKATEEEEMELGCGASVHGGDENELRHSLLSSSSSSSSSSSFPQFVFLSARENLPGIINKIPR